MNILPQSLVISQQTTAQFDGRDLVLEGCQLDVCVARPLAVGVEPQNRGANNSITTRSTDSENQESTDILELKFQSCSWDDVLESMLVAKNHHDGKGETSKMRSALRNRTIIVTLQSLTNMIPDQYGLSVMRGGLKYVFDVGLIKVAMRRIQAR